MPAKPKPEKKVKQKKRKKKTERQLWEIRLDQLVKEIVLERDGECVCPPPEKGHSQVRQPGHLITRGKESVKWDGYNVNEQCSACNMRHEYYPEIYTNWFLATFGQENYLKLVSRSTIHRKLMISDLETMYFNLTEIQKNGVKYWTQEDLLKG